MTWTIPSPRGPTHEIGGRSTPAAFVHGLFITLEGAAAIAAAGALVAAVLVRPQVDRRAATLPLEGRHDRRVIT